MEVRSPLPLAPLTTFRIGGPAKMFVELHSVEDVEAAVALARDRRLPLLILGAGSNILVPDDGVDGVVAQMRMSGISFTESLDNVIVVANAGLPWDSLVRETTRRGLFGIENLAGIPGTVGGAVVQNIGAYGAELSQTFLYADCIDTKTGAAHRVLNEDAALGYRSSCFSYNRAFVILRAAFRLTRDAEPNLSYKDLAQMQHAGTVLAAPAQIAEAVRKIRAEKFPSPEEGGCAGSFFKNPTVSEKEAEALRGRFPGIPLFPQTEGRVKVSLAWILDHVLNLNGYVKNAVRLYEKQPIVFVTSAGATAAAVDALAQEVCARVFAETHIMVEREVETFGK